MEGAGALQLPEILSWFIEENEGFPNNSRLPVLLYTSALPFKGKDSSNDVDYLFRQNGWEDTWIDGVHDYHHYHSTAHEVLGIGEGSARIQLGGPFGVVFKVRKGDVLFIPAGVAHKCIIATEDFKCVGAYPKGQKYDMNFGKSDERPDADRNIKAVPLPGTDPVFGRSGPLLENWKH
jgi:uncharacterized protein YjlB